MNAQIETYLETLVNTPDKNKYRVWRLQADKPTGTQIQARLQAERQFCRNGHEYTPENTKPKMQRGKISGRRCLKCDANRRQRVRQEEKEGLR